MKTFDLNINNYNIEDLEIFFKLSNDENYTISDIELRENKIRDQLMNSENVSSDIKRDIIFFLNSAKDLLIEHVKNRAFQTKQQIFSPKNYPFVEKVPERKDNLIQKEKTQFIFSQNGDFFPGEINPLKTRIINKCITIDTRCRDDYYSQTSTNCTFQLPFKLSKVVSMQLTSFEIPISFYGISSSYGNNYFWIEITYPTTEYDDIPIQEKKLVVVPDGNYNSAELIDTINNILCPKNTDGTYLYPNDMFSWMYFYLDISNETSGTGKITLNTLEKVFLNIKLDFASDITGVTDVKTPLSSKLGWSLGFIRKEYNNAITYTAESIIEPAPMRYMYLAIDDYNNHVNNTYITALNQSILNSNIIARIAVNGLYFNVLMQNNCNLINEPRQYFGPVDIQKLRVQLLDDYGRVLDNNNCNFSFCLTVKLLYDF